MDAEIIVVGAGLAGLSCARALTDAGRRAVVLDRARGAGGRCATRRIEGQPVDHGLAFIHGADPQFLESLSAVTAATPLPGWPVRVRGAGAPCQPDAFAPGEQRLAFVEGLTAFPKHLARGIDIRLGTAVTSVAASNDRCVVRTESSGEQSAPYVVLALAMEQTLALLPPLDPLPPELDAAKRLLGMVASHPCLTVIAGHPNDVDPPGFDITYPEDSKVLQLIAHDSAKRREPGALVLVHQARARWSRERLDAPPETWGEEILVEAGRLLGPWAAAPEWRVMHRWRFARVDWGDELSGPMLLRLPGGGHLGLAGEVFAPGGGAEAAWQSGRRLAARILSETSP